MSRGTGEDRGSFLVLSVLLLAGAAVTAIGVYSVLDRTQHEVVGSGSDALVDRFLELRLHVLGAYDTAPPAGYNTSYVGHIEVVTGPLLLEARASGLDVNITRATPATVAPGSQELAWVSGGVYDGLLFGDRDVSGAVYDGDNDGVVFVGDRLVGVLVHVSMAGVDGSMKETLAVPVR